MATRERKAPRKALWDWMVRNDWTQKRLADAIGCDPSCVHHWLVGNDRPDGDNRNAVERITNGEVRAIDWPPKKRKPPKRRRSRASGAAAG